MEVERADVGDGPPKHHRHRTGALGIVRWLYHGASPLAYAFRYTLLVFDLATIAFLIVSSFLPRTPATIALDVTIGLVILADLSARIAISREPLRELLRPLNLADVLVVISFLAPLLDEGFAFLRALRILRVLRSYPVLLQLKQDFPFIRYNTESAFAVIHLFVFIFVMTALVYQTQHRTNPEISNYVDALYFTVTALTTTGFGDITLQGSGGRLLSVVIMICGVSLFLHLFRVLFRPTKVEHECPSCGLTRHDPDAVHCKHCGLVLHIRNEGDELT